MPESLASNVILLFFADDSAVQAEVPLQAYGSWDDQGPPNHLSHIVFV